MRFDNDHMGLGGHNMRRIRRCASMLLTLWITALYVLISGSFCAAQSTEQTGNAPSGDALPSPAASIDELMDMDLDELSQVDVTVPALDTVVTTVSRQESTVGRSPAAVFVITQEMIHRSGANNIPDLLRMVPGLQVAQLNANRWAITARGFNGVFASKLLVLVDGRAVYSQMFNGVFWDEQNIPLPLIERVEVVRGPGAAVWGANAVNGVINIITKSAEDTQGVLFSGGTGTEYREFGTAWYGSKVGDDLAWRIYGNQFDRDDGRYPGGAGFDEWQLGQGGFRTDWEASDRDLITVQGDFYRGRSGTAEIAPFTSPPYAREIAYDTQLTGQNYLARWTHEIDETADWSLQAYFDRPGRSAVVFTDQQQILDVDFEYHVLAGDSHNVISGAGYRRIDDVFQGTFIIDLEPGRRNTNLYTCFIQDEIELEKDRLYFVAGSKFEHNDFTGFEFQPNVRLLFLPSERAAAWAAVSRAVRTPSRVNDNLIAHEATSPFAPVFTQLNGNDAIVSEDLLAFELGYRTQPTDEFSWDLALFYNNYTNLIGVQPSGPPFFDPSIGGTIIPLAFNNALSGDTYGAELASTYRVTPDWEITGAYTLLYMDIHASARDVTQGSSPNDQVYLRSSWNPRPNWQVDVIGRYVDNLPALGVSSYLTGDVRIAWQPSKHFEWAVVGRNLIDSPHREFADPLAGFIAIEVEPEVFTTLTWSY